MTKLKIIYYCWINKQKKYKNIICGQLNDVANYGILNKSKLYIEVCNEDITLEHDIRKFIYEILQGYEYEIVFHKENTFEYYGIKKIYDLAVLNPTDYFIYFHSKGMFNYPETDDRHIYETTLTTGTFHAYDKTIEIFNNNPEIMKICLFPSNIYKQNFCWLNFFWARGTYLITCDNPIISSNRYYYEVWSESGNNSMGVVYNLLEHNYKKYELYEVGDILNKLQGTFPIK